MATPPTVTRDPEAVLRFTRGLTALIARYGGVSDATLDARVEESVQQTLQALQQTAHDGESLSPRDVVRIRTGKFVATRVPAAVFRDVQALAALRAQIALLSRELVGDAGGTGSRF